MPARLWLACLCTMAGLTIFFFFPFLRVVCCSYCCCYDCTIAAMSPYSTFCPLQSSQKDVCKTCLAHIEFSYTCLLGHLVPWQGRHTARTKLICFYALILGKAEEDQSHETGGRSKPPRAGRRRLIPIVNSDAK